MRRRMEMIDPRRAAAGRGSGGGGGAQGRRESMEAPMKRSGGDLLVRYNNKLALRRMYMIVLLLTLSLLLPAWTSLWAQRAGRSRLVLVAEAAAAPDDGDGEPNDNEQPTTTPTDPIDNFTQIPIGRVTQPTSTSTTVSSARQQRAGAARREPLRVSETELLPFAEFNVQQPAFGDLIRSWPPTTLSAAHSHQKQQPQRQRPPPHQSARRPSLELAADEPSGRNHLNEDLDDTVVTADQGFERDQLLEPPTWINYLGEAGDYIYLQLRHQLERWLAGAAEEQQQLLVMQTVDELLDDRYYDQYENSQVLYYGPQLVREGDLLEIGCYMPLDQPAEWTKSGRPLGLSQSGALAGSPRAIRRSDFLGAKLNFSLKIYEAALSDSGNYRCNKMSRKYHKLVVVPLKTSTNQLYLIQQRLLSVVSPRLVSSAHPSELWAQPRPLGGLVGAGSANRLGSDGATTATRYPISASGGVSSSTARQSGFQARQNLSPKRPQMGSDDHHHYLLPGYLIVEQEPLAVTCNISDELVLRRLREQPAFTLSWYKNGKLLRFPTGRPSLLASAARVRQPGGQLQSQQPLQAHSPARLLMPGAGVSTQLPLTSSGQRVQLLQANGRQLYISSAQYSDAGEYLCSWAKLGPTRSQATTNGDGADEMDHHQGTQTQSNELQLPQNPLAAGSQVQLMAPVKLRPFKSAYHVRQGHQLRLICQLQRGFPGALISWYVGNRLVDAEFLREHEGHFRLLQFQASQAGQVLAFGGSAGQQERQVVVEINPVPSSRVQMSLTQDGRGQWVEYRGDTSSERLSIETHEQQLSYLQQKLAQLTGSGQPQGGGAAGAGQPAAGQQQQGAQDSSQAALNGQAALSVLVINSLDVDRDTSRYACRATSRANTDEVTTVVRVQASSTISVRPTTGRATLIPGQPLHFECSMVDNNQAEFLWYRRALGSDPVEEILDPNADDTIEIHNERLTLLKPTYNLVADYICRALKKDSKEVEPNEEAIIKVRTQPYIEDFGQQTSHTGKSSIITDGDKLVLTCTVRDKSTPVNITWLRSLKPDDDTIMYPVPETKYEFEDMEMRPPPPPGSMKAQTYLAPDRDIVIEQLGSHSKRLVIDQVRHKHRSYYVCIADNGVTERIVAELFILFTIIHIWETQRAYKEISGVTAAPLAATKRPASGASATFESVPLTNG